MEELQAFDMSRCQNKNGYKTVNCKDIWKLIIYSESAHQDASDAMGFGKLILKIKNNGFNGFLLKLISCC